MKKLKRNFLIFIFLISFLIFGLVFWLDYSKKPSEKKEISLPQKEKSIEELLEELTPKEPAPKTEKEKAEEEKLLKELTPKNPKPMTEKEKEELEELLKQLTP